MPHDDPAHRRLVLKYKQVARQYGSRFGAAPPALVADPQALAGVVQEMVVRLREAGEKPPEEPGPVMHHPV